MFHRLLPLFFLTVIVCNNINSNIQRIRNRRRNP